MKKQKNEAEAAENQIPRPSNSALALSANLLLTNASTLERTADLYDLDIRVEGEIWREKIEHDRRRAAKYRSTAKWILNNVPP